MNRKHTLSKRSTRIICGLGVILNALLLAVAVQAKAATSRQTIEAAYIPLADHYAALVAYELFRENMVHADFKITQMKNWDLLKAYFLEEKADMAFVMSPLAMDMFHGNPKFRWVGLMHRDGNALAVNSIFEHALKLSAKRLDRHPDESVALALKQFRLDHDRPTYVAVPHVLSTHSVVLYTYLKQFGVSLALQPNELADVLVLPVAPPKAPFYIKSKGVRGFPSAFEQSLPWADVVETQGFGKVAWYSKDVMKWPKGHVECITIASDDALDSKYEAVKEVVESIHKAGEFIEQARVEGGSKLEQLILLIRKHIPAHTADAIRASLDPGLKVINYQDLHIDKAGLEYIMEYALDGKILKHGIDVNSFMDKRFLPDASSVKVQDVRVDQGVDQ